MQRDLNKTFRPHLESGTVAGRATEQGVALLQETLGVLTHLHESWLQAGNVAVNEYPSTRCSAFDDVQRTGMERHCSKIGGELLDVFGLLTIDHQTASTGQKGNRQFTLPLHLRSCHDRIHDTLRGSPALQLLTIGRTE